MTNVRYKSVITGSEKKVFPRKHNDFVRIVKLRNKTYIFLFIWLIISQLNTVFLLQFLTSTCLGACFVSRLSKAIFADIETANFPFSFFSIQTEKHDLLHVKKHVIIFPINSWLTPAFGFMHSSC